MDQNIRPDLLKILQLGATGVIDFDHFERWQKFKEQWSEEDKANWRVLLGRMHKTPSGIPELIPPLTNREKVWVYDLVLRAESMDLC
jgi:hypothetical protein